MRFVNSTLALTITLAVCFASGAFAQSGSLTGQVTDSTGAVIPGAIVEATNEATGIVTELTTSASGQYVAPALPFGSYQLAASAPGFGVNIITGVVVTTASETSQDIQLQLETVAEEVTVSATVAQLETTDTTVGAAIEENLIRDAPIPVQGQKRRPYQYIELSPGVNSPNGQNPNIAGSRVNSTLIMLDGLSTETTNNGQGEMSTSQEPSVEAIGEYKLLLSNTSAEFGRTSGGLITYATKSGTNAFHGSLWNYHNNSVLNARAWQAGSRGNSRNNEFGAAGGGPVIRNKTFFWGTLAYYRQSASGSATPFMSVMTQAMRGGDFSQTVNQLYDRASQWTDGDGNIRYTPFENNQIPASRRSRVTGNLLPYLPLPNSGSGAKFNYLGGVSQTFKPWDMTAKVDHHFNERHRLSAFYQYGSAPRNEGDQWGNPNEFGRTNYSRINRLRGDYSWVQSPSIVHQIIAGTNYHETGVQRNNYGEGFGSIIGLGGTPESDECPWIQLARAAGEGYGWCTGPPANTEQRIIINWSASTLINKGNHTIKIGYQGQNWQVNRHERGGAAGGLTVGAAGTYLFGVSEGNLGSETKDTTGAGGDHLADFYLGLPNFVGAAGGLPLREREAYHALYIQDDWKVSPKLTVNIGLRWDLQIPFSEMDGQYIGFGETLPNTAAPGYPGAIQWYGDYGQGSNGETRVGPATWNNFGPRAGIAYSLSDKLVFRAGAGIQYMAIQDTNVRFVPRTGFEARGNVQRQESYSILHQWDSGFPQDILGTPPFIDPTFLNNQSFSNWMNPKTIGVPPQLYFISAGFQYQLKSWVLETTFFSNMGRNNHDHEPVNAVAPQYWALGRLLNLPITDPEVTAAGFGKPYPQFPDNLALNRVLRRWPQYGGISNDAGINTGMNYNSFMLKATKRYSNGLSFLGHWTVAKQIGDVDWAPGAFGSNSRNPFNRRLDKRINRYDTTHRVVLTYSYDLPFGPGEKWGGNNPFSKYVLGGWTISGVQEYASGFPMTVGGGMSLGIPGGPRTMADRIAGVPWRSGISCGNMVYGDPTRNYLLNAGNASHVQAGRVMAWQPPGDYIEGNAPEVDQEARTCPNFNENLSVLKRIPITESLGIQLGADCFNCLNRHRWITGRFGNNINSGSFGNIVPDQPKGPRTIQLRMRIQW